METADHQRRRYAAGAIDEPFPNSPDDPNRVTIPCLTEDENLRVRAYMMLSDKERELKTSHHIRSQMIRYLGKRGMRALVRHPANAEVVAFFGDIFAPKLTLAQKAREAARRTPGLKQGVAAVGLLMVLLWTDRVRWNIEGRRVEIRLPDGTWETLPGDAA